ncbi:MAG: hypothetical protein L6Q98_14275 [Anaerolineae bacterium]|nr:hypothetical protein [Anaerolineae bacterium]NUQ03385.1 hypothetical protein [Anaerolineae bacterium]
MAGELSFTTSSSREVEECSLLSRVVMHPTENSAIQWLDVGFDSDYFGFVFDRYGERSTDYNSTIFARRVDLDQPHHLLYLAVHDRLVVYMDGELVLDDFTIDERSGTFGVGLIASGPGARCEGRNIWAYEVPIVEPGVCEITSDGSVNRRSGPGTSFEWAGTLSSDTVTRAVAQAVSDDNFTWWQLEDGTWVREDVVNARGDCQGLPLPGESAQDNPEAQPTDIPAEATAVAEETNPPEAGEGASLAEHIEALSGENLNCTVRTEQEQFASVRVGPGSNRTAILFLPAARDFRVLGQAAASADDGALWWKLDKEAVSSRTSAAELWVAQDQVTVTGEDCELVPYVEPPPIIEIVAAVRVLPREGLWTYNPGTVSVECPAGYSVFESSEPSFTVEVRVAGDGSRLEIFGVTLTRVETGIYQGQWSDVVDGLPLTLNVTVRVAAQDRLVLEGVANYDGCTIVERSEITG